MEPFGRKQSTLSIEGMKGEPHLDDLQQILSSKIPPHTNAHGLVLPFPLIDGSDDVGTLAGFDFGELGGDEGSSSWRKAELRISLMRDEVGRGRGGGRRRTDSKGIFSEIERSALESGFEGSRDGSEEDIPEPG